MNGQNDLAWRHPERGAIIQINASCDPSMDLPLRALTNHLLIGFTEREIRDQQLLPMAGREALTDTSKLGHAVVSVPGNAHRARIKTGIESQNVHGHKSICGAFEFRHAKSPRQAITCTSDDLCHLMELKARRARPDATGIAKSEIAQEIRF